MIANIKAISYYLPSGVVTNEDLVKTFPDWSVDKIAAKIGVSKRHISKNDELSSDMAISAARNLFVEHDIKKEDIDFIILCTQSPDYFLPPSACIIQDKLGIPISTGAFDFNLGCSGFIYGLAIAKGLIFGGIATNILLLTAETYSKFIHPGDRGNRTIFGDAAAATLISGEGFAEISEFDLGTDGKGAQNLIVKAGGLRNKTVSSKENIRDEFGNVIMEDHLLMNGGEIFNFTIETVPNLIENTLRKNNLSIDEVDLFVFHQANKYILDHLRKVLSIPESRFYYYMETTGNTVSSTIPIALYEALREKKVKRGSTVLIAGFGVGYSWGGTILKFV
jgi:3-oxoacyl-[acyl-carrier-protein] synthase-3